jgi:hypothetical protein
VKTYEIYLTTGETLKVKCENFDCDYSINRVIFRINVKNVAIFTLNNICGFKLIEEE